MKRSRFVFAFLLVAIVLPPPLHAAEQKSAAPLPIERMRATVYTKAFAKRFALPDPEPGTEPEGGIQAMEFAVEPGIHGNPRYYCKLYLYFDNTLPVAFPEGPTGKDHLPSQRTQLMTFAQTRWLQLSEQDRLHFNERNGRYTRMTWFVVLDQSKKGGTHGMFYEEYHKDIFPNLAYIKIDTTCGVYSWMANSSEAQVWLKREGAKDYRKQLRVDPEDFLKFTIPPKFYRQMIQWRKQAADYNRPLLKGATGEERVP